LPSQAYFVLQAKGQKCPSAFVWCPGKGLLANTELSMQCRFWGFLGSNRICFVLQVGTHRWLVTGTTTKKKRARNVTQVIPKAPERPCLLQHYSL
jgi:hypothetical protein